LKRNTVLFWILITSFLSPLCGPAWEKPKSESETVEINRLVGLCKLRGHVKYFHPSLAYRADIDWDAALVATIPKVRKAKTTNEYEAALQGLLDILGDSNTRVVHNLSSATTEEKGDNQQFEYQMTEDGVLLITVMKYLIRQFNTFGINVEDRRRHREVDSVRHGFSPDNPWSAPIAC
jgi:hypothetical protein